jgi:hypothetical protein
MLRHIVDLRLRCTTLRGALYEDMRSEVDSKPPQEVIQGVVKGVTLTGLRVVNRFKVAA